MTNPAAEAERRALLQARARRLTDPLGAKGFRRTGQRVRAERTARRTFFVATLAGFTGIVGLIASQATPAATTTQPDPIRSESIVVANAAPVDTGRFQRANTARTAAEAPPVVVHKQTRSS